MREPRGVPLGDLRCDMCHRLRQGGAKYASKPHSAPDSGPVGRHPFRYTLRSLFATPMSDAHFCSDCYHTMLQREETGLRSSSNRNSPWAISNRAKSEVLSAPHKRRRVSGRLRVSGSESELFQEILEAIEADDRNHEVGSSALGDKTKLDRGNASREIPAASSGCRLLGVVGSYSHQ
ncbi:hypothetical protein FOZ63_013141 [Perkinsus olseni]|uniref:Uncharacterized protein n=1 Tax=Perkinsus olseni TaxID=32597 RepID=A0A7J6TPH3_PEROL|nr:hypothetical protein FOZ63_013141 [Perkinsus olseni]